VLKLPKLKIRNWSDGYAGKEIRDFEQARYFLFNYGANIIVAVEGQVIKSYEELVWLAGQDCYKNKEFLEVELLTVVNGG
jgi:hypothetical protein